MPAPVGNTRRVADPRSRSARPARDAPAAPTPAQRDEAEQRIARRAGRGQAVSRATARAEAQRTGREQVIYSKRWRTPLIVDIVLGSIVLVLGLVLAVNWSPVAGGGFGALGGLYAALAVRRWRLWAGLRGAAAAAGTAEGPGTP